MTVNTNKCIMPLLFILAMGCGAAFAQKPTMSLTVINPVCPSGSGSVQVSFTNVSSYPFTLYWNGSNVQSGSISITGSPQTISITGGGFGYGSSGTQAYFYDGTNYFGEYPVGITFDPVKQGFTASCSGGLSIPVNNITGGTSPYTISLVNRNSGTVLGSGSSPLNLSYSTVCPNNNGRLSIRVTDANGCYASVDSPYIYCQGLNVQLTTTAASCTNGTATVTSVSGGASPYTYLWSNAATSSVITGLVRGSYSCIVTDANSCSGISYTYVDQNPYIGVNTTIAPATCNNPDGQATAFATGGTAPYTYLWGNGSTTQSVNNLDQGQHKVTVTDANSCSGEQFIYINAISPVQVTYSTTPSSCTSATGSVTLSVSGGQSPYTYVWDGLSSTTNTATGLAPGNYSFKVTDVNGCERRGVVTIPPISQITATVYESHAVCPSTNGSAYVFATSGATPLTYLWSNGTTTSSVKNVSVGSYTCTITDANSCKLIKYLHIGSVSPVKIGFNTVEASCKFTADGIAIAKPSGGTAPYTYLWSNGATTATVTGLKTGRYTVTVTDANGCRAYDYLTVGYDGKGTGCYCELTGTVYNDLNGNCTKDAGEDGIPDVLINTNGGGYTTTDANGVYSIDVPSGSYTIEEILDPNIALSSCQSNNIAVSATAASGCSKVNDFANQVTPVHDIHVFNYSENRPVPGNVYYQTMVVKNNGNVTETAATASHNNDGQLSWLSHAAFSAAGTNRYELNPVTLKKGQHKTYKLRYFTPTNVPMGTLTYFRDSGAYQGPVSTYWITNEETPWNNICDKYATVVSSYDPNYKEVYPAGDGPDGNIFLKDKDFRYVIHFENNGTWFAQKVVVIDTLDPDFDITSFRTLYASHNVKTHIDDNRVVTFTFDNINLDYTPKNVYKATAQGLVAFTIKAKNSVAVGTKLTNKADIYFDYNAPVTTNTTVNTYVKDNTSVQHINAKNTLLVYPNPAGDVLHIASPDASGNAYSIEVYNMMGQVLMQHKSASGEASLDIGSLSKGMYIIRMISGQGNAYSSTFMKQ